MPVDPSIYGFISQPYRYALASDPSVQTNYEQARVIEVPGFFTSLAEAEAVNTVLFNLIKEPRRRFAVEVQGVDFIGLDDFDGEVPCFTLKSDRYALESGLLVAATGILMDPIADATRIDCWG